MGTATYRVGPSDVFSPGDLQADAQTLNGQITSLDNVISTQVTQDFWDGWQLFLSQWKAFYSGNLSSYFSALVSAFNDGTRDELISFENQFTDWASKASKQGASLPGPVIAPSTGTKDGLFDQLGNALGLGTGTIILVVVVVVGLIVLKVLK